MNIDKLFSDKQYLEKELNFFISKKHIKTIQENKELVQSHLKKARHNIEFYKLNKQYNKFNDWLIVTLYYVLYHSALALITNKNYSSKNHYATILILIKEYSITKDEAKLLNDYPSAKKTQNSTLILKTIGKMQAMQQILNSVKKQYQIMKTKFWISSIKQRN